MNPSFSIASVLSGPRLFDGMSLNLVSVARLVPVAFLALVGVLAAQPAEARYTSIIIDAASGAVIQNDNADVRNYPASLTKMMTLYLTFEALDSKRLTLDQDVTVSSHAENQAPSRLGLHAGETIRVESAILAVVTKSANDMAVVLAETLAGSEAAFSVMMNQKARSLGMSNTTFRNASGLPNDQQMTTARDLATLSLALVEDWPQYYRYFSRTSFSYNGQVMANHNHLMSRYPGMDGIKTGFINKSGFNLAASAVRDGHRLVAVVMGGPSARARDNYMASLLDAAFRRVGAGKEAPAPAIAHNGAAPEAVADAGGTANTGAGDQDEQEQVAPPAASRAHAAPVKARGHVVWVAQLGSFKTEAAGRSALNTASRHLPSGAGHPSTSLQRFGSHRHKTYRAQLVGFKDEKTARLVCSKVKVNGRACTVAQANH